MSKVKAKSTRSTNSKAKKANTPNQQTIKDVLESVPQTTTVESTSEIDEVDMGDSVTASMSSSPETGSEAAVVNKLKMPTLPEIPEPQVEREAKQEKPKRKRAPNKPKASSRPIEESIASNISFDPKDLSVLWPDVRRQHPVQIENLDSINLKNVGIVGQGQIVSLHLSEHGRLLCTFSSLGITRIWDTESWQLVQSLIDRTEEHIDEFFCGAFLPDGKHLVVAGKRKDRKRWSTQDGDNHILPCHLKVFDVVTGDVVNTLVGHEEEILSVQGIWFKGEYYLVSSSQDGHIMKWKLDLNNYKTLITPVAMTDTKTCMAFNVAFLPNTGNKYFIAGCDEFVRLFDFELATLINSFDVGYSSYCDFVTILPTNAPLPQTQDSCYVLTRGVELLDDTPESDDEHDGGGGSSSSNVKVGGISKPNSCGIHRLSFPSKKNGQFTLETVKRLVHEDYHANSWLIKLATNGVFVAAPTVNGKVFIFDIDSSNVVKVLHDHEDREVRDVVFHPYKPQIITAGDDGTVKVYEI